MLGRPESNDMKKLKMGSIYIASVSVCVSEGDSKKPTGDKARRHLNVLNHYNVGG